MFQPIREKVGYQCQEKHKIRRGCWICVGEVENVSANHELRRPSLLTDQPENT